MTAPTSDVLTADEVLLFLGIGRTTLYRLRKRGELEAIFKPSRAKQQVPLRFRRQDVERLAQPVQRAG